MTQTVMGSGVKTTSGGEGKLGGGAQKDETEVQ
jgi:hypothetical protein